MICLIVLVLMIIFLGMVIDMRIFLLFLLLSGCAGQVTERVVYVPVPLTRPDRPVFDKIPGRDLSCVSEDTRWLLLRRDIVMKDYMGMLEKIIDSSKRK